MCQDNAEMVSFDVQHNRSLLCGHPKKKIIDGQNAIDGAWPKQIEKTEFGAPTKKHGHQPFHALCSYLQATLLLCPVIDRLGNNVPSTIHIAQISTVDRCSSGQGQHDGSQWRHLVVDLASFLHINGLEGDLKAAASHAKGHRVHVDVIRKSCPLLNRILVLGIVVERGNSRINKRLGRVLVVEDGCVDCDLGSTASADVGGQSSDVDCITKKRMRQIKNSRKRRRKKKR